MFAAPSAWGATIQFGHYGEGAGAFIEPFGIAVQNATGDVIVLDSNNHRIERFTRNGDFRLAWGWGVADGRTNRLQSCRKACFPGLAGTGAGEMLFAEDVAVDNDRNSPSYNDVYIADLQNHRVEKFGPSGQFLSMFGREVNRTARGQHDRASEDRCPVQRTDRCGPGTAGRGEGQFEFPVEGHVLAVGADGAVYVGDRNRVERFSPRGVYESEVALLPRPSREGGELGGVSGLAVDSHGDIYVIRNGISGIREYRRDGELLRVVDDKGEPANPEGPSPVVTLDRADNLYVDEFVKGRHQLREYDPQGREVVTFDVGGEEALHGLAYSDVNHRLYVINTNSNVKPPVAHVRVLSPPTAGAFASFLTIESVFSW